MSSNYILLNFIISLVFITLHRELPPDVSHIHSLPSTDQSSFCDDINLMTLIDMNQLNMERDYHVPYLRWAKKIALLCQTVIFTKIYNTEMGSKGNWWEQLEMAKGFQRAMFREVQYNWGKWFGVKGIMKKLGR